MISRRFNDFRYVFLFGFTFICWAVCTVNADSGVYIDLGRPIVGAWQRKAWLVYDPVLKKEILWSQESSQDGAVFYGLDPITGKVIEAHDIPAREVGGVLTAKNGILYLYTYSGLNHPGNEMLRFNPRRRRIERLGLADTPRNRCVDGVIGKDGNIYIGTHQQGRLFRFNPTSAKWKDLGQMVPADLRSRPNIWLRNLQLLPNGKILGAVVTSPPARVVEIDPANGSFRVIESIRSKNFVVHGEHIVVPQAVGLAIYDLNYRKRSLVELEKQANDRGIVLTAANKAGILTFIGDHLVRVNLKTSKLERIAKLPFAGTIVPSPDGGRAAVVYHPLGGFAMVDVATGKVVFHKIGYKGKRGTQICGLHKAADGSIYGTNIIGMHIFRYDPKSNKTRDLGHVGWQGGEVYNVIDVGGKIYFGTYGGGIWGVYDPRRPWEPHFRTSGKSAVFANPRNLGPLGGDRPDDVNRPFEYATSGGKIYIAARANYGHRGGALVEFDPSTAKRRVFRDELRSVQTVTAGDGMVFGGTSIHGGRGSGIHAKQATVFSFDPKQGKRVRETPIDAHAVVCLRYHRKAGLLFATTDNQQLLALDAKTLKNKLSRKIRSPGTPLAGVPEDVGMIHITVAGDGNVYGVTSKDLFRLNRKSGRIEYLEPPPIPNLYQIVEGEPGVFYMGAQTHLLKFYVDPPAYYR